MIARPSNAGVALITQPDHAHLARAIMEHAAPLAGHPRRDDILLAIGEHDNGWAEPDAEPVVDAESGRIADFIRLPLPMRHEVWRRGVPRLAHRPWAAALVAHHAITVYDRYRDDGSWVAFFEDMARARESMRARAGLPMTELEADYVFLRLGDLISLAFCTAANDRPAFGGWEVAYDAGRVRVSPDPFGGRAVPIEIEAREIPDRAWRDDGELRAAVRAAPVQRLRGAVAGA